MLVVHALAFRVEVKPVKTQLVIRIVAMFETRLRHLLSHAFPLEFLSDDLLILLLIDQIHDQHGTVLGNQPIKVHRQAIAVLFTHLFTPLLR